MSAAIEERLEQMEARLAAVETERDEYRKLYELLREENARLKRGFLGRKAERTPADAQQLSLSVLGQLLSHRTDEESADDEVDDTVEVVPSYKRRKPRGRKPLPEHYPVERIELLPDEVRRKGLDAFDRIGEEVKENLEKRYASPVRVQIVRPKFVRKGRPAEPTQIHIADPPELPIPKGLAGPGMLADTVVKRWADHLPLHRQEEVWAREGLELARSTMCAWHQELATLVQPLIDAMFADAYHSPYLCVDATGVLVWAKKACRRGHFWVLIAPGKHILFRFTQRHDSTAVDALLAGYEGYLVADAHVVYDHLYEDGSVVEVGCWAHARRYFFKALSSDPDRAKVALGMIGRLFGIERELEKLPRKKKERARAKNSRKVVNSFFAWCMQESESVLDDTPIADGIRYALNQEAPLRRFLEDGRLPIHNNWSEGELRREAVGRKNWLFVGSEDGATANTTFVSLIASCKLHGIEPWSYLRDLFILIPSWPHKNVIDLAPANWAATAKREDVSRKLESNIYRRVTMGLPAADTS